MQKIFHFQKCRYSPSKTYLLRKDQKKGGKSRRLEAHKIMCPSMYERNRVLLIFMSKKKVMFIASTGGHLEELLQLKIQEVSK